MSRKPKMTARNRPPEATPATPAPASSAEPPEAAAQPPRPVVPTPILEEIERLIRRVHGSCEFDWEFSARVRVCSMLDPGFFVIGYIAGAADGLGVGVDDLLDPIRFADGTPVLDRERSPRADQLAEWLARGASEGTVVVNKTPLATVDDWHTYYTSDTQKITRAYLPDVVEDDIAVAVAAGKIPADPEILAEYRRGWLFALLDEIPDPLPPRPARTPHAA